MASIGKRMISMSRDELLKSLRTLCEENGGEIFTSEEIKQRIPEIVAFNKRTCEIITKDEQGKKKNEWVDLIEMLKESHIVNISERKGMKKFFFLNDISSEDYNILEPIIRLVSKYPKNLAESLRQRRKDSIFYEKYLDLYLSKKEKEKDVDVVIDELVEEYLSCFLSVIKDSIKQISSKKTSDEMTQNVDLEEEMSCFIYDGSFNPLSYVRGWDESHPDKIIQIMYSDSRIDGKKIYSFLPGEKIHFRINENTNSLYWKAKEWYNNNILSESEVIPISTDYYNEGTLHWNGFSEELEKQKIGIIDREVFRQFGYLEDYNVSEFDDKILQKIFPRRDDGKHTHPYLIGQAKLDKFLLLYKKEQVGFGNEEEISKDLNKKLRECIARISYQESLNQFEKERSWYVFSDERIIKKDGDNLSFNIMYSVISPWTTNQVLLSPGYHGYDTQHSHLETYNFYEEMLNNNEVTNYSFEIAMTREEKTGWEGEELTHQVMANTLPIITEIIRQKSFSKGRKKFSIQFHAERYGNQKEHIVGDVGDPTHLETALNLKKLYDGKYGNGTMRIKKAFTLLAKRPNEHPFMQYPDIVGRMYDTGKRHAFHEKTTVISGTLKTFEDVRNIIVNSNDSLKTITKLIDQREQGLVKFIVSPETQFLDNLLAGCIEDILENEGILEVLKQIRDKHDSPVSQNISKIIFDKIKKIMDEREDIKNMIEEDFWLKFNFNISKLADAEMKDNYPLQKELIRELEEMKLSKDWGMKLQKEDHIRYRFQLILVYQNWFKFDCNLSEAEGIYNKNPKSSDEKKLLACMALSFLLEGDTSSEKYGRAEEYEKHLLETTSRKEKYSMSRRKTYELEIGIIRDPEEALEKINIEENPTLDISNSYYLAAVLKCIALNDFSSGKNQEQLYAVKKLLDSLDLDYLVAKNLGHPHQRIAYWYIRAHLQIWPERYKTEKINKCIDYLIDKLHKKEWFNSLGVILVCELLDLVHRLDKDIISNNVELQQIQGCDLIELLQEISDSGKTAPETKKWLEQNWPDEEDWLRPLNYNYR